MSDIFAAVEQLLSILKARSKERAFFMRKNADFTDFYNFSRLENGETTIAKAYILW